MKKKGGGSGRGEPRERLLDIKSCGSKDGGRGQEPGGQEPSPGPTEDLGILCKRGGRGRLENDFQVLGFLIKCR